MNTYTVDPTLSLRFAALASSLSPQTLWSSKTIYCLLNFKFSSPSTGLHRTHPVSGWVKQQHHGWAFSLPKQLYHGSCGFVGFLPQTPLLFQNTLPLLYAFSFLSSNKHFSVGTFVPHLQDSVMQISFFLSFHHIHWKSWLIFPFSLMSQ